MLSSRGWLAPPCSFTPPSFSIRLGNFSQDTGASFTPQECQSLNFCQPQRRFAPDYRRGNKLFCPLWKNTEVFFKQLHKQVSSLIKCWWLVLTCECCFRRGFETQSSCYYLKYKVEFGWKFIHTNKTDNPKQKLYTKWDKSYRLQNFSNVFAIFRSLYKGVNVIWSQQGFID